MYIYKIQDETLKQVLNKLDGKYLHNYDDWWKIMGACKLLNKYDIFQEWCKQSPHYNKTKNMQLWNSLRPKVDINWWIRELNKKGENFELAQRYKPIKTHNVDINTYKMNNKYLYDETQKNKTFNYKMFKDYETIIIKSCTGTGKTTAISKHVEQYMKDHPEMKILTITNKRTLSDQHMEDFKNINLQDYRTTDKFDKSLTCCINSLNLVSNAQDELDNYIIYIDEIDSFLKAITHNNTLNHKLKPIYAQLCNMIKNAHKVIVSDAVIRLPTVCSFLHKRTNYIYVENGYKNIKI